MAEAGPKAPTLSRSPGRPDLGAAIAHLHAGHCDTHACGFQARGQEEGVGEPDSKHPDRSMRSFLTAT